MAVTKMHPIKSTLKAAIDYIYNLDKPDGKLLVSAFDCAAETTDIEFEWTRRHSIDKGTHLGCRLIQAFEPGEVSAEKALRLGCSWQKKYWVASTSLYLPPILIKGIFTTIGFSIRSASPIIIVAFDIKTSPLPSQTRPSPWPYHAVPSSGSKHSW